MSYSTPNNTSRIDRPAAIKSSSLLTLPTEKVLVKDISSTTIRTSSLSDFTKQIPLDNKKTPLIKSIWNSLLGRRREDEDPPVRLLRTSASASKLQDAKVSSTRETNWIPDTTKITVQEARRPKPFIKKPVESAYGSSYVPPRPKSVAVGQNSQYSKYSPKMVPRNEYYKTPQIVKPAPVTNKKPGEDVERNDRHGAVVALLSGRRKLPFAFTSRYKLGEVLGDGAFGFVMTAKSLETGKEVAIKFIIKAKIPKDNWDRESGLPVEVLMLSRLKHPNIIKFVEYFTLEDYILLITELHGCEWNVSNPILSPEKNQGLRDCPRAKTPSSMEAQMECSPLFRLTEEQEKEIKRRTSCDLFECIDAHRHIPENTCKFIIAQIALAVKYMNDCNIVHRDLKDENIVIDSRYNLKLIDFGSASFIPTSRDKYFTKFNGTAHFASPEIVNGNSYRGPEAEIWSMGVLLFTIVCGENPFQNRKDILRGSFTYPTKINGDLSNLIDRMLHQNEKTRITIDQVLEHRWLKSEVDRLLDYYTRNSLL